MNPLAKTQIDFNTESRGAWDIFTSHRRRITELLQASLTPRRSRLCVLGAGNSNDLDLQVLLSCYREIHLVDLDAEALAQGVARQGLGGNGAIQLYGGLDVTGMLDKLGAWPADTVPEAADLVGFVEAPIRHVTTTLPLLFDVVASTCLLSQLMGSFVKAVGEHHPRFLELLQALRLGHLRLLTHLIAAGGAGLLVSDFVSSDSFAPLGAVPEEELFHVLAQLVRERNFFHGVNPAAIAMVLRTDPVIASQLEQVEPLPPWRWNLGPRLYAVWAMIMKKRREPA
jgi:hypothetical protein